MLCLRALAGITQARDGFNLKVVVHFQVRAQRQKSISSYRCIGYLDECQTMMWW